MRLQAYRDEVLTVIKSFVKFKLNHVPRTRNDLVDSLVVSACAFIPPFPPQLTYEIKMKYRPSLPDNVKFWKVFEDNVELTRFLGVMDEFADLQIDAENENEEEDSKPKLRNGFGFHEII